MFEEFKNGTAQELAEYYSENPPKGEIVILVSKTGETEIDDDKIVEELREALKEEKLKKSQRNCG